MTRSDFVDSGVADPTGDQHEPPFVIRFQCADAAEAIVNGLPLIIDDTQRAANKEDIKKTIYAVVSGRSKSRASRRGTECSRTWHTVLISSGEKPLTSHCSADGVPARVITFRGSPFGRTDQETAGVVRRINEGICRSYGQAGP